MDFFELVKNRRSIRVYEDQPVAREDVLKILDAANWAPSAMNWQPWEFIVVSGNRLKQLSESYVAVVRNFSQSLHAKDRSQILSGKEFSKFAGNYGNAPVVVIVLTKRSENPNEQRANFESACAAMQNLILAASHMGLGTCWMTSPLNDEDNLRRLLDIPESLELVAITPLGFPKVTPKPLPRKDPHLQHKIKWLE